MMHGSLLGLTGIIIMISSLLSGCGFVAQQVVEQTTGAKIDQSGQTMSIKGKDGEAVVLGATIPDELKGFPVAAGFTPQAGASFSGGGDKGITGVWKGKGDIAQIAAFFKKELTSQGWTEDLAMDSPAAIIRQYLKGDDGAMLTIGKEDKTDSVTVSIILSKVKGKTPSGGQTPAASSKPGAAVPSGPPTTDVSNLPAELRDIPMPTGFSPIKDTISRQASGGKFTAAAANWYGKGKVQAIVEFFQKNLPPKGWEEEESNIYEDSGFIRMVSAAKKQALDLTITVMDDGMEIMMALEQN
jgi:hypothetical protein